MYLHTVRVELSHLHETILREDIVASNVASESVKANFLVFSRCHFNLRTFIYLKDVSSKIKSVLDFS